ncbi:MAG: hypothetical protein NTV23_14060 [Propionibacteriales bacterium]|nr:hypothetical protein [Propionibacteriales bacterium]
MSEPTAPDSEHEDQPDAVSLTKDSVQDGAEAEVEPEIADPDAAEPVDVDPAPVVEPAAPAGRNRQLLFIAAALVVALALGGGLFFIFRGGDDAKPASAEDQAKAAVIALLEGTYKVASGDKAGCQQLVDNLVLTPEQSDFYQRCVDETAKATPAPLTIDSIKATKVTLNDAAGTGTVDVDVAATVDGKSETKSASVPVKKVDGRWKVDPLA